MAIRSRWCAEVEVLVPFHDIDAMRIVWHGNYFRYFEVARCALLASIDYDYEQMGASGYVVADRRRARAFWQARAVRRRADGGGRYRRVSPAVAHRV